MKYMMHLFVFLIASLAPSVFMCQVRHQLRTLAALCKDMLSGEDSRTLLVTYFVDPFWTRTGPAVHPMQVQAKGKGTHIVAD